MKHLFTWTVAFILAAVIITLHLLCAIGGSALIIYVLDFICGTSFFDGRNVAILALVVFIFSRFVPKD